MQTAYQWLCHQQIAADRLTVQPFAPEAKPLLRHLIHFEIGMLLRKFDAQVGVVKVEAKHLRD